MAPTIGPTHGQTPKPSRKPWVGDREDEWDTKSVTKGYHRMTVSEAKTYVAKIRENNSKVLLEKLQDDEHRIKKNRARLSVKLHEDLRFSFKEWCDEVYTKGTGKEFGDRCTGREDLVKPSICDGCDKCTKQVAPDNDPARDMNAYFMFFEKEGQHWKGRTQSGPRFREWEKFPDQRMSIYNALHDDDNPFKPPPHEGGNPLLRYIHIPANHMGWVEEAMARYHDEHKEDPEGMVKTSRTLSREHWKGQLHGSGLNRNPVHATHMRPRCSVIPKGTQSLFGEQRQQPLTSASHPSEQDVEKPPHKDLAIFMPYLHWETSSRATRMSKIVQEVLGEELKHNRLKRRTTRPANKHLELDKYAEMFQQKKRPGPPSEPLYKPRPLGQYLLNLARVWQAMDLELDERMVRKGLVSRSNRGKIAEPSLHVRRTLDQSYFLNLTDTSQRDKDQVVYRATQGKGNLARVVMVDQLWLWILDEHTIITSFPKRWGRNKPDPSGIHKSLRDRLSQPDCKIMSAWHLAFIIIDQCSNVFFDRTKPLDLRPEVMDIFAEALGDVNHYTAIAFKVFWRSVETFTKGRDHRGSNRQSQRYLDINPEGTLLREAQDIAEELRIMIGIFSQQLIVVKSFQKCLEHMNGDSRTRSKPHHLSKALQHLADWVKENGASSQVKKDKPVSLAEMDFLEDLVEEVENRKEEIMDLESAARQTCQQLQELLSLKQQQASIVEAKAALDRADQSVEQGKAIMAFTIITIIFTPLGFFTSFFGMNNSLTGADWMTLGRQCLWMFCISATIIIIALSLALKTQLRNFLESPQGPRAQWNKRLHGKDPKPGIKTAGEEDESQPNETNDARADGNALAESRSNGTSGAMEYFRAFSSRKGSSWSTLAITSRNRRTRSDVENSIPMQTCENGTRRSKTT